MYDEHKAMTDAINAITRLNWGQLLLLNRHVAEHIDNIWQHQLAKNQNAPKALNDRAPKARDEK